VIGKLAIPLRSDPSPIEPAESPNAPNAVRNSPLNITEVLPSARLTLGAPCAGAAAVPTTIIIASAKFSFDERNIFLSDIKIRPPLMFVALSRKPLSWTKRSLMFIRRVAPAQGK
jgi:hypothetical protein